MWCTARLRALQTSARLSSLDDNLEGLCHISELSEERVEKPEDVVQLGQEMEFQDSSHRCRNQKIGLSARAVGKDEPIIDTKVYSSQVGSGMASLGELAGLARAVEPEAKPAEPKPEPESEPTAVREPEPEPEVQKEPEPEPAPEPVDEPKPDAEPESAAAAAAQVESAESEAAMEAETPDAEVASADESK